MTPPTPQGVDARFYIQKTKWSRLMGKTSSGSSSSSSSARNSGGGGRCARLRRAGKGEVKVHHGGRPERRVQRVLAAEARL